MLFPRLSGLTVAGGQLSSVERSARQPARTRMTAMEIWDLWYPNAGSQGLSFCRARLGATDALLVHAAPENLRVEVRDQHGSALAFGDQLRLRDAYFPMTRLRRSDGSVIREDGWPAAED